MHDGKWLNSQVASLFCPWQGRGDRAEVTSERTPAHTKIPVFAMSSLLLLNFIWTCHLGPAARHIISFEFIPQHVLQMLLHAIQFIAFEEFTIRHCLNILFDTAHTNKPFDMRIPWRNVAVADGQINTIPIACGCRKIHFCPSCTGTTPD